METEESHADDVMAKAMEALGWSPNAEIPMANEENQALLKELEQLTEQRSNLQDAYKQNTERYEKLLQHTKNAKATINHNMKLLQAYQEEMRTEAHLFKVYERECSKMKQDNKHLDKELEYIIKYEERTESELERVKNKIDDMTNRIQWFKAAKAELDEAMKDGRKGCLLIEKYVKEDEHLAKEQEYRRQKLVQEIEKRRAELVRLYDEQKCLEQNLDCTSQLYRTAHAERRQMVETWKTAVRQMTQRENDIINAENELQTLKTESKKKDGERKNYDNKLNKIIANNREVEAAIEEINSETADLKDKMQKFSDLVILKENEVELIQKELQGLSNRVQQQRSENATSLKKKEAKMKELSGFDRVLKKLEKRLDSMENKTMTAQQRLQLLEEMNDGEQRSQNSLAKQITQANGILYRAQEQLAKCKDEEKTLLMANSGITVTITAVKNNMQKTEKQLQRLTEDYYNQSFKAMQMERKLQGEFGPADPELEQTNKIYLQQLEEQNIQLTKKLQLTDAENKMLDDNMRKLTLSYNADCREMQEMQTKIKEVDVYYEGGVKRLKDQVRKNQMLMVDISLLKLRIKESEDEIAKCQKSCYNLEKHRLNLDRTMKNRMIEIQSQMELLQCKRKHLNEENSTLKADIGERNIHINAMKTRFDLTSQLLGRNEDGSLVTATQLKVEIAQEKQMLIEQGNELNERNLKAEHDVKAMENTLKLLHHSNEEYRKHYQNNENSDQTMEELKQLQNKYCKALSDLKDVRFKILEQEKQYETSLQQKEMFEQQLEMTTYKNLQLSEKLDKLRKEIEVQIQKLQRAERDAKAAQKILKQRNVSSEFLQMFEKDLDLRDLENKNIYALSAISDFAETNEELGPTIIRILHEAGLQTVRLLKKTRSSVSSSSGPSRTTSISSKDAFTSTPRSSVTESSARPESTRLSVVSIEFGASNLQK